MTREKWMMVLKRASRSALAVIVAAGTAYYQNSPYWLILGPVLEALGKTLREAGVESVPF